MNELTIEQANKLFQNKIVFITEVDWEGFIVVVDGKRYQIRIEWNND